jgi:hypothetical protein
VSTFFEAAQQTLPPSATKSREAIILVASGEVHFAFNAFNVTAFAIEMAMEP